MNTSSVFTLAAITFANGGDNIAVYAPLFARSDIGALVLTVITFSVLIFVWCLLGYWLGSHPVLIRLVDRYGHIVVPFVLIGLGVYIMLA